MAAGTEELGRFGECRSPGGRFAFLSHGRAVVNAESTARSSAARCSRLRTSAPEPSGANRWVTRIAPDGATTSIVGRPAAGGRAGSSPRAPAAPSSGCPDRRPSRCRRRSARPRSSPGTAPAAGRAAARRRRARGPSCGPIAKAPLALLAGRRAEQVEGALGLLGGLVAHRPPPPSRDEAHRGLDRPLRLPRRGGHGSTTAP